MTQVQPFNPWDSEVQTVLCHAKLVHPVRNLTDDEILTAMRLLQLYEQLGCGTYRQVVIGRKDRRLELVGDQDRFLAMLLDGHLRGVLLTSKRCRSLFGGTPYHWRKIGRTCPITDVASAVSEFGSGYYGRGWVIRPHVKRLIKWIIENYRPGINNLNL